MKRTSVIILVTALVTAAAYSAVTPVGVQAQAEPYNYFQFDCESSGCIYDFDQVIFGPGQRVVRAHYTFPGEAVRNMFWPQIHGARFTDYNVTWEQVRQNNLTNTGVVKFVLNKPARDHLFVHYLHVVWSP